jgi:D-glycero-alpha-D-manno-heptose-7-phosphate kinase
MIYASAPLRIALAGGGTDLPAFYSQHGSTVLTCAIDKYVNVIIKKEILSNEFKLRYSENEIASSIDEIKHSRARECLKYFNLREPVEITSISDLPPGTGMGSSGSYLVSLISAISKYTGKKITKYEIANLACEIEMVSCNQPVGKQDQFIASFGGIKMLKINNDGHVKVEEPEISSKTKDELNKNCMIFYTGMQRNASSVLKDQQQFIKNNSEPMMQIQKIGFESIKALENNDVDAFGSLMHEHWIQKKNMSSSMSFSKVDEIYLDLYADNQILGGKIIGAGGGGFLLIYVNKHHNKIEEEMSAKGLQRLKWNFDESGVKVSS